MIVGAPCEEPGGVNECGAICLSKEQGNELVRGGGVVAAWYRYYVSKWEKSIRANKQNCHEYDVVVRQAVYRKLDGVHMCTRSGAGAGGGGVGIC